MLKSQFMFEISLIRLIPQYLLTNQAIFLGLFPPVGNSIWDNQLKWQPIPVHTMPNNRDEVLAMQRKCPAYDIALEELQESKEYTDRLSQYQGLMEYVTLIFTLFLILILAYANHYYFPPRIYAVVVMKLILPTCQFCNQFTGKRRQRLVS